MYSLLSQKMHDRTDNIQAIALLRTSTSSRLSTVNVHAFINKEECISGNNIHAPDTLFFCLDMKMYKKEGKLSARDSFGYFSILLCVCGVERV